MLRSIKAAFRHVVTAGGRAAAANADAAYRLQLSQYKTEQNQHQLQRQLVQNELDKNAALLSEIETLKRIIANQKAAKGVKIARFGTIPMDDTPQK